MRKHIVFLLLYFVFFSHPWVDPCARRSIFQPTDGPLSLTHLVAQDLYRLNNAYRDEITNVILPDFQVNENAAPNCADNYSPSISIDNSGNFVISWFDQRWGFNIYAQRYSSDGSAMATNFRVNDRPGSAGGAPSISADGSGNFVITWGDSRIDGELDIYAQRYLSDGTVLGSNFLVNDDQGDEGQGTPSISIDASGNFVITWGDRRNGYGAIYAQRYSSGGSKLGENFKVNGDTGCVYQTSPSISSDASGNFVIIWEDYRNDDVWYIYAQRHFNDGSKLGENFRVNDDQGEEWKGSPSISADGSGNFVITWGDRRIDGGIDIYAQRYSSDGSKLGENFIVNEVEGSIYHPWYWDGHVSSVSSDSSGNFVIAWMDSSNDIYAQRYSSDGTAIGSNFLITDMCEKNQSQPDVKLWDGQIYSTWTDNRGDGTCYDIWANVLDWDNPDEIGEKDDSQRQSTYQLIQNFPNPFNPSTTIKYALQKSAHVTITVYNTIGQVIETLVNKPMPLGQHQVAFNGQNLPSGVYFYRIEAGDFVQTRKMLLVK